MRKHDFWPFHWFSNGQKWGVKKASLYVYFEGLTTDSYSAKQDSLGRGHIEKWAFLHSSDEKTWFLTFPLIFKWSKMGGLKKLLSMSILKVWQLTLILAKQDPGERSYRKKAFLHSSDEKTWFLTFPLIFKWSKMGGFKKASLYVHYEGLTTDSYFGKARPLGRGHIEKMGFFTLFWWENMISDLSIDF